MLQILRAYSIPEQLVIAIGKLYENFKARVISPDGETELFEILAGVLQGDTLAPYLFIIILDYAMREALKGREEELGFTLQQRLSRRHDPIVLTDLDFADDSALVSESLVQAQIMLERVETSTAKIGLHLNSDKTEVMLFNQTTTPTLSSRNKQEIKQVSDFKYLGAWMSSSSKDIGVRKGQAWAACNKLKKIWSSGMRRTTKIRLFLSAVEPILMYGCETWTLTETLTQRLDGCYTRMLRMVQNISWKQHITNNDLYGKLPKLSTKIRQRRLRLASHCIRHPEEIASELVLWEPTRGKASRGRRAVTFTDTLLKDTELQTTRELKTVMKDRDHWRGFVGSVRVGTRPR